MTNLHIRIELTCPKCYQASLVEADKLPAGKVHARCNRCAHRFPVDKNGQLNCKIRTGGNTERAPLTFSSEAMEWMVDHKFCNGIQYDLKGLATLIRSGLITKDTRIRPPGSGKTFRAGQLVQLRMFFDEKHKPQKVDLDATIEGEESNMDDKSWYQMDCSDFIDKKLIPFLKKDLTAKKVG